MRKTKIQEMDLEYHFDYKEAKLNRFAEKMNLNVGWTVDKFVEEEKKETKKSAPKKAAPAKKAKPAIKKPAAKAKPVKKKKKQLRPEISEFFKNSEIWFYLKFTQGIRPHHYSR